MLIDEDGTSHTAGCHSAGLIGQLRKNKLYTRFYQNSTHFYEQLQTVHGLKTGFERVGGLRIARN
jgi:glycine/D-amino acid oxidase-like deaminating enzyme